MIAFFKVDGQHLLSAGNRAVQPGQLSQEFKPVVQQQPQPSQPAQPVLPQAETASNGNGDAAKVDMQSSGQADRLDQEFERY